LKYIFGFIFICFIFTVKAKDLSLEVVSEHWPPFIIQNAEKAEDVSGIVTNKIKDILTLSNLNYTINTYPWARSYHLATTKPNVLIYSIYKTKKRAPHFTWFCPIHPKTPVNIYKLRNNKTDITTLTSLKKAVIGVLRNDNSHNYMLNNGFTVGGNLTVSSNEESNIKNLLNGKIDAVIQSREALIYRLQATGFTIDDLEVGFQLHQNMSTEHCMALSKGSSPEVISALETAFNLWQAQQKK
tara:strand:+ start:3195 stop:3920 length:726 start_codon:yes stop_codon:yes gene_type:complete